jgi:hypothetical protein
MIPINRTGKLAEVKEAYTARLETFLRAAAPRNSASPQAVEAALASISEEVTTESIERRRDKDKQSNGNHQTKVD